MPSTQHISYPLIPPGLQKLIDSGEGGLLAAEQGLPGLLALAENVPGLNVPGLDTTQRDVLANLVNTATANPDLAAARGQIAELTSGPVGSSPATVAGMKAYRDLVAPQIATDSALRGTAAGGQGQEALALGEEQAAVPLIQQEIQNRQQAIGADVGIANQQQQALAQALEASGLPREVALQEAEAAFQQQQQKFQFESGIQAQPESWFPLSVGQFSKDWQTMDAADWIGGIGKGLNPSSLFGSSK